MTYKIKNTNFISTFAGGKSTAMNTKDMYSNSSIEILSLQNESGNYYGYTTEHNYVGNIGDGQPAVFKLHKFPFSSDSNINFVSDTSSAMSGASHTGISSPTAGYLVWTGQQGFSRYSCFAKFNFSNDSWNYKFEGPTGRTSSLSTGHSTDNYGFWAGGSNAFQTGDTVHMSSFASDLLQIFSSQGETFSTLDHRYGAAAGTSSETHGYISTGLYQFGNYSFVTSSSFTARFSFSSSVADTLSYGSLQSDYTKRCGLNSPTHGYVSKYNNSTSLHTMTKFPFGVSGFESAVTVGLKEGALQEAGISSAIEGYCIGNMSGSYQVQKFNFFTDGDASNVGNLTQATNFLQGHQV